MKMQSLEDLSVHALQDIYDAEQQALKALPELRKAATTPALQQAFEQHLQETKQQVERLDQVFSILGKSPKGAKCPAMQGLIKEAHEAASMSGDPAVKDAALIAAAQKQEHYEIAAYGTAVAWAKTLNQREVAQLLAETLAEEEQADRLLTEVAERSINIRAVQQ